MLIKAIRFRTNGFATQSFASGGEEGPDAFDAKKYYRSGLTNYLIDAGDEVILVDTGIPAGTPEEVPDDWVCPRCKKPKTYYNKARHQKSDDRVGHLKLVCRNTDVLPNQAIEGTIQRIYSEE